MFSFKWFTYFFIILLLSGCGSSIDDKTAANKIKADIAKLKLFWDEHKSAEFIDFVNQTTYIHQPESHVVALNLMRKKYGAVRYSTSLIVNHDSKEELADRVAQIKMMAYNGNMKWTLLYNKDMKIVGYHVSGKAHK